MPDIFHVTFSDAFCKGKLLYFDQTFIKKIVPKGPADNKSALVQVKALCQTYEKPILETVLVMFYDTL